MKKLISFLLMFGLSFAPIAGAYYTPDGADVTTTGIEFEGTTADANETTITVTDPTADRTVTVPDATGTVALAAAAQGAATGAVFVANGIEFEGATADAFETTISVTDPTGDRTITIPDVGGNVNVYDTAGTDDVSIVFEGATADAFETTLTVTDPTADRTVTVANATGTVIVGPGAVDAANAVTLSNNAVVFEGATADAFETTVTATDPTADRAVTLPQEAGSIVIAPNAAQSTSDLGWAIVAGANTACNTTCTNACVFGVDNAATEADIVACTAATADECLCAGAA